MTTICSSVVGGVGDGREGLADPGPPEFRSVHLANTTEQKTKLQQGFNAISIHPRIAFENDRYRK
jgi:hypothetical protein